MTVTTTETPDDAAHWEWRPGPWVKRAACVDSDPRWFDTPSHDERVSTQVMRLRNAATICASCPVRWQCYSTARRHRLSGVWGGHLFGGGRGRRVIDLVARLDSSAWWLAYASHRRRNKAERRDSA